MAESTTANAEDLDVEAQAEGNEVQETGKGSRKWLWIFLLLIVFAGGGAAGWFFFLKPAPAVEGEIAEPVVSSKPHYLELDPGFVVNLDDPDLMRYLQLNVQIMAHDSQALAEVETYMPEIRNRLLLLFAQQKFAQLIPRSGKENLQAAARDEINAVLKAHSVQTSIEAVLFTSFVMQ